MTPQESAREYKIPFWKGIANKMNGDDKKNGLWVPMGIFVVVSGLILQFLFGSIPTRVLNAEKVQATHSAEIQQLKIDSQELKNDVKTIKEDVGYIRGVLESQQRNNRR